MNPSFFRVRPQQSDADSMCRNEDLSKMGVYSNRSGQDQEGGSL